MLYLDIYHCGYIQIHSVLLIFLVQKLKGHSSRKLYFITPPFHPPLHDVLVSNSSKMQSLYGSNFPEVKNIDVFLQVSGIVLMIHKLYISMVEWNFI